MLNHKIHYTIIVFMGFLSINARSQIKKFTLEGKIEGQKKGIVSLTYMDRDGKKRKDSCQLKNGYFNFRGEIKEPTLAVLRGDIKTIADDDSNAVGLYLEPGKIQVSAQYNAFKQIRVRGSHTQTEFELLQKQMDSIKADNDSFFIQLSKIVYQFINTHPDSYVSAFHLSLFQSRWTLDSVRFLYDHLNISVKESYYGKQVNQKITQIENNSLGHIATNFTAYNILGNQIRLSDFKGKYVLLDFWASWCIPCRKGNPLLIKLFNKYHNQGLNIISISDDIDEKEWKSAIVKDGISVWTNVLSGIVRQKNKIDDSRSISKQFAVQVLPTMILINPAGIIIGRYSGTEYEATLHDKLAELLLN